MQITLIKYLDQFPWLPLILVFAALPTIYYSLAVDVHKDYAELIKNAPDGANFSSISDEIDLDLHIFDLDWWIVLAIAALFLGLFQMGDLVQSSRALEGMGPERAGAIIHVRSVLVAYATAVGCIVAFVIAWARLNAARRLRCYYMRYRTAMPEAPKTTAVTTEARM